MCGICGIINFNGRNIDKELLVSMTNSLIHRGPDEEGYYLEKNIGLGVRRLSIIDLKTGSQPIPNEDKTLWVIENGEIYNFLQLRRDCLLRGHSFRTHTDTEVILHLYEDFDIDFVKFIKGMFAIAIYDKPNKKLILIRDRIGIKPIYYYKDPHTLIFASEIKAILKNPQIKRKLNLQALYNYLCLNYIPSSLTIYENIFKLPSAHILICDIVNGSIKINPYWDLPLLKEKRNFKERELKERLKNILQEAVKRQLISDVPLGVFLSGGLDSSTVVAMMHLSGMSQIKTFSIGFEDKSFNELPFAKIVARHFKTQHHEFIVKPQIGGLLPRLVSQFDEPFGDSSAVPVYYTSKLARESGVKTVLTGEGGDENFGGYYLYLGHRILEFYQNQIIPEFAKRFLSYLIIKSPVSFRKASLDYMAKRFIEGLSLAPAEAHYQWHKIFSQDTLKKLFRRFQDIESNNPLVLFIKNLSLRNSGDSLNDLLYLDFKFYLTDDLLVKVDRMSMLNSLEARVPLLDEEVIEFMATLPSRWKVRFGIKKYLLKKTMRKILPFSILHRRKAGFSIPLARWLKEELKEIVFDNLFSEAIKGCGLFDMGTIKEIISIHNKKEKDLSRQIWGLLVFSLWYKENKDSLTI
ncbi:MAG: asparagine synthase (glutamine-hydrolyzing) [Candidatus Omnitrophica bacterium]|nr:asparagine synthase (glutamine-hydrolyzing) [Candidatus Omnitrophota bacterium]